MHSLIDIFILLDLPRSDFLSKTLPGLKSYLFSGHNGSSARDFRAFTRVLTVFTTFRSDLEAASCVLKVILSAAESTAF